jgi:hypothetical protein
MAAISVPNSFTNGTAADATEVNANFDAITNGLGDGTKDISVSAITAAGATTLNGAVTLGNATGDDITVTGYVASSIIPKTNAASDLGSATNAWQAIYLDDAATSSGTIYFDAGSTYFIQGNTAVLDIGGFTSLDLNTTANIVAMPHCYAQVNTGSDYDEGAPPYTFTGDTDTGMFSETANTLNFSTGGTLALTISSAQLITAAGAMTVVGTFTAATCSLDGAVTINESGADVDFRVEGDTDTDLFFVDASTDRVGISTNAPVSTFHVAGTTHLDGAVTINEAGADVDFRVEGDTEANLFVCDASTDRVGINIAAPLVDFHCNGDVIVGSDGVTNAAITSTTGFTTSSGYAAVFRNGTNSHIMELRGDNKVVINALTSVTDLQTDANGVLVDGASDIRLKDKVKPYDMGLREMREIRAVTHQWREGSDMDDGGIEHPGFVADEVKAVEPRIVGQRDQMGLKDCLTFTGKDLMPMAWNSIQELSALLDAALTRIERLEKLDAN